MNESLWHTSNITMGKFLNLSEPRFPLSEEGVPHIPQVGEWFGCHAKEVFDMYCLSS